MRFGISASFDHGVIEPEVLCGIHKLRETWNGKRELAEVSNLWRFEARGRHSTNNRFQLSANASEPEHPKCDMCRDWRM